MRLSETVHHLRSAALVCSLLLLAIAPKSHGADRAGQRFTILGGYALSEIRITGVGRSQYDVAEIHFVSPLRSCPSRQRGGFEVSLELFVGHAFRPRSDSEIGLPLQIRYWLPARVFSSPNVYLEAGAGPAYFTRRFEEQHSRFNFADFAGVGIGWPVSDGIEIHTGYRFRHVSNAGLGAPNRGVNGHMALMGIALRVP